MRCAGPQSCPARRWYLTRSAQEHILTSRSCSTEAAVDRPPRTSQPAPGVRGYPKLVHGQVRNAWDRGDGVWFWRPVKGKPTWMPKTPVDAGLSLVSLLLQGLDLPAERFLVRETLPEAAAGEDAELDLRHPFGKLRTGFSQLPSLGVQ